MLTKFQALLKPSSLGLFFIIYSVIFLFTRLINLTLLPIHYDELIHLIRVREIVDDGEIFIGVAQGLKGLQLWLISLLVWLPAEILWVGRFVSAVAGLVGALGSYVLAVELYKRTEIGIMATIFYLVVPFLVFYDRIALADSLLTALSVWLIIFSLWLVRQPQLRWAIAVGLVMGACALTKASGMMNMVIPFATFLLFSPNKKSIRLWRLMIIAYALAAALSVIVLYFMIISRNLTPYSRENGILLQVWIENFQTVSSWLMNLLTPPVFILGLVGLLLSLVLRDRRGILLMLLPLVWVLILTFAVRSDTIYLFRKWYPRYLLPITPSVIIMTAWVLHLFFQGLGKIGLSTQWRSALLPVVVFGVIAPSLYTGYWLLFDPAQAPLHAEERRQYIEGWPTTYGLPEASDYVENLATQYDKMFVAVNDSSLIIEEGLKYYFDTPENVDIEIFFPFSGHAIDDLNRWALERPTFLVLNPVQERGLDEVWEHPEIFVQGRKLTSYPKPGGHASIDIYQWLSPPGIAALWAMQSGVERPLIVSQYANVTDAEPLAELRELTKAELSNADFLLVDPQVVESGAFAPYLHTDGEQVWLDQTPPGLELTLFYPGLPCSWCLFRVVENAPPQQAIYSTLDDVIALTGFDLDQSNQTYSVEQPVQLTLHWQSLQPVSEDYMVFAQLIGPDGQLYAQQDQQPFHGRWATSRWQPGQQLADRYNIPLDPNMPAGSYKLIVGMYHPETGERLTALGENQEAWPDNAIILTEIVVRQDGDGRG